MLKYTCMEEEDDNDSSKRKRPLDLEWDQVLGKNDGVLEDDEPHVKRPATTMTDHNQFDHMRDEEIEDAIKRQKGNIVNLAHRLCDKGEKLRGHLKALEAERDRRRSIRPHKMDGDGCGKPIQLMNSGAYDGRRQDTKSSVVDSESKFAPIFSRKMEEKTDSWEGNAFDDELAILGHCNRQKNRPNEGLSPRCFYQKKEGLLPRGFYQKKESLSPRGRKKGRSSSREWPYLSGCNISLNRDKHGPFSGEQKRRASSNHHLFANEENYSGSLLGKKDCCQAPLLSHSWTKKAQTIVLVDEDEMQPVQTIESPDKLPECMKDVKIYYPSRKDPESVEIWYTDTACLAPEGYLTSPIMNFYIRYLHLHGSPRDNDAFDYHFFNTFFYKKLKQALSYKGSEKELFFAKFRRWWKGVNIFEKAYVLIPIHEDVHWSLAIVCIPEKEDESGPIILHLDSLGLHCSTSVFDNIKRYLIQEWKFISQDVIPVGFPIAYRIWKNLPCRIEEKIISVPQQKNDYDCGLFVLFFMERFMVDAPERLKKKDLSMFSKQWFRPELASDLRGRIWQLLLDKFQKSRQDGSTAESTCSSGATP